MEESGHIYHHILRAEVLLHGYTILKLLPLNSFSKHDWVDDREHLVLHIRHDKGAHASNRQVKVVDGITLLVEVSRFGIQMLL